MNKEIDQKRQFLNKEFKQKGLIALKYRNECIGMLPEIFKLRAYEKEHCSSIYEYAAKFAGISNAQVANVLRLEKRLKDKPALREVLITGAASHNKITRVISIATKDNDQELAQRVKINSRAALDIFVKDFKNQEGVKKADHKKQSLSGQTLLPEINILEHMSDELQKDLIERHKKGININNLLKELLNKHDIEIEKEMEEIGENAKRTRSKYVNIRTKKILSKKYGKKCAVSNCQKEAQSIHHTNYQSISHVHDPRYIAPLCKGHHEIAHTKNEYYFKMRQNKIPVPS